jgi:serine/threonine protein kinase
MSRFDDSISYFSDLKSKKYRKIEIIGKGAYGEVYRVFDDEGNEWALKQIPKNKYGISCMLECIIMNSLYHPGLHRAKETFCTKNYVNLIQEKAISDLSEKTRRKVFNLFYIRKWMFTISEAVYCLHKHDIIHADIKANNLLYFSDDDIRLTDFSLSTKILVENGEFEQPACTYSHCPPETLLGQKWNKSLDIWSLGCTFYEVAFGHCLFPHQEKIEDNKKLKEKYHESILFWFRNLKEGDKEVISSSNYINGNHINNNHINNNYINSNHINSNYFVNKLANCETNNVKNFEEREPNNINYPKESTVLSTLEYLLFKDLIYKMLVYNKEKRLTIEEVLNHSFFGKATLSNMEIKYTTKFPLIQSEMSYISNIVFKVLKNFKRLSVQTMTLVHSISISIFLKCLPMQKIKNIKPEDLVIGCIWIALKIAGLKINKLETDLITLQITELESEICIYLSFCIPTIVDGENI